MIKPRTIPSLRWWIAGLLFLSTVLNYIDRQTLSVLAPFLKSDYQWTNADFALIVISFRIANAIGQSAGGRLIDRIGTRNGLSLTVLWYSIAAMMTSFATGLKSFCTFRFFLGAGEAANWPGATKAVSEWFPKRERGLAVALFESGGCIGAAIAPFLVVWLYHTFGGWRYAFVITGSLGFLWLVLWRLLYHRPENHPRISELERDIILKDREDNEEDSSKSSVTGWLQLLRLRKTWGVIFGRALIDPVWFFVADWFVIYLVSKDINLEEGLLVFWIPFVAADLGNFFGGGISSWLIHRGWSVVCARKAVVVFGGLGMFVLAGAAFTSSPFALAAIFGFSMFAYASFSTMVLTLPSDLFQSKSVATVSGLSGTAAQIGTILCTFMIGYISDHYSFTPILIVASIIPVIAVVMVLTLIRTVRS
ncbi:MAG: MFS transporter [Bacteroidetes bacterium GWF2_42_66]|nr:MAG: MFS transporter [Bacteroidetes bacterium GWA2_42_15]OFY02574.1 MAG: MFS transporter [Bacteroidetes bacterium GWE2_42_39]OFY41326.1 MAG: MFS transporter [Bacteroidetes bacterium GWF2_42_66]HAZ04946.1 MFS transporter [Marinilabiliales bacterium]HBL75477.1 MFS transporter [Prolixibacteraceae bacterium]